MPAFTRRDFLKVSSATLGACSLRIPATVAAQPKGATHRDPTRIYVVMFRTAPSAHDTDVNVNKPMTNEEIIQRLKKGCVGVEFVVRDMAQNTNLTTVVNEAKDLKRLNYDGVIICGYPRDYDLLRSGLPTINIGVLNDFMNTPFPLYKKNRVVDAFLDPWRFSANADVSEKMFDDLIDKIKLIKMLKRMKTERILTVTDSPYVNVTYGELYEHMPENYNDVIRSAINETFGTQVVKIGTKEVVEDKDIEALWRQESPEANEIAQRWIGNAKKMINTTESEIVRSAKVYLAMKMLMEKHDATSIAFHIRTLTGNPQREEMVFPALATSEFQLNNVVGKCQSHLNILLSEMMLQYAFGRPSMLGDYAVDPYNNTSMIQHCEGPWNPWGGERRVPYILTDHRERRIRGRSRPGVGGASWVLYPADEIVTMWQIDVQSKEVLLHTGKTLPMLSKSATYRDHLYEMM